MDPRGGGHLPKYIETHLSRLMHNPELKEKCCKINMIRLMTKDEPLNDKSESSATREIFFVDPLTVIPGIRSSLRIQFASDSMARIKR